MRGLGTLAENIAELKKLFGEEVMEGASFAEHPIRQSVSRVLSYHGIGDHAGRDYENSSISLLVKNLEEIRTHDDELLRLFRDVLQSCNDDTYSGIRFEISVAASLIRRKVPFEKTERPDFRLRDEWDGLSIECGSAHLSKPKTRIADLKYKVGSVIREKSQQEYCSASTALFIDFTNINYHDMLQQTRPGVDELKTYVARQLRHSAFGSIVMWTYILNLDTRKYQWKYTRVDASRPERTLVRFLQALYPFGQDVTHAYGFLRTG